MLSSTSLFRPKTNVISFLFVSLVPLLVPLPFLIVLLLLLIVRLQPF